MPGLRERHSRRSGWTRRNVGGQMRYKCINRKGNKTSYVHRKVIEDVLGKPIPDGLQVHHINGNRLDNSIKNLQLISHKDHRRIHQGWRPVGQDKWEKLCSKCNRWLEVNRENFWFRSTGKVVHICKSCSRLAGNHWYRTRRSKHAASA